MTRLGRTPTGIRKSAFRIGLSMLVLGASALANAQYFFRIDVPPSTLFCNADSVDLSTTTSSWNLPQASNNAVFLSVINGVRAPDYPDIQTITPASGSETAPGGINPLGSPSFPYTVVVQGFPAINGTPIGTGVQIVVQCSALGAQGVATFSVVQAPSASAAVPAMSSQALIALAVLLAGTAAWQFRRRRV